AQAVGAEVEARGLAEDLLRQRAPNCRRLHEAVAGEPARGVDAVRDLAEDRVRVGGHVVETGPGALDPGFAGRRVAVVQARKAVIEERLVNGLLEAPARLRIG